MRVFFLLFMCAAFLAAQSFQAGTARREVTPTEPVPMWGYGDRHDKLSEGVLDPLYADALVLDAGGKKIAIVGLDLGRAPAEPSLEKIRARILKETGIESSLIGGSHTHHGPVLELSDEPGKGKGRFDAAIRYYARMEDAIAQAVIEANAKLQPARLAAGSVQLEGFNVNRHTKLEPKPSDRELAVLRVDTAEGKPLAVLVNWAAHPTTLPSSLMKFSADYVGVMKAQLTKETGAAAVFIQGAAGDQSIDRSKGDYQAYGAALAAEAVKLARSLAPQAVEKPALVVKEDRLQFKPRMDLKQPFIAMMYEKAFFPELVPNYQDEYANGVRPRLTVALLNGDIAMVGASGEFFSNHAIRLKERARMKHLFFFGYCNGYHQYFPTIEAVAEGGYGADPAVAPAAVGAGEEIMNLALKWLYQMRGKIRQ
ncbi:MAG: neutral/alkaline non-lysosomal ceramidase N-terminal domain-containing protein [Acidobacteria bacterium]|nr:neutral/alkaline non-lysosomal ceramidase N-terminal domain-containing protein [Acidobacteriota bacterium]